MITNGTYRGLPCIYINGVPHTPRALCVLLRDLVRSHLIALEQGNSALAKELAVDLRDCRLSIALLEKVPQ